MAAVVVLVLCSGGTVTVTGLFIYERFSSSAEIVDPGGDQAIDQSGPIDWWMMSEGSDIPLDPVWSDLAEGFAAANPDAGVDGEVELELRAWEGYREQLEVKLATGTAPDLFYSAGGSDLREQVENGQVRDLTDELADVIATLSPGALAPYTVDGRVYGLPYSASVIGIWFNRALFADAGLDPDRPPASWEEFEAAVAALAGAGITPIALAGAEDWTSGFWYGCLATTVAGSDAFEAADQQRSFTQNPDFQRAAELLAELVAVAPFQAGFEQATYVGLGGQVALMADGEAAMELTGPWAPGLYDLESSTGLGDDLGWFPFPEVTGGQGAPGEVYGGVAGFAVGSAAPDQTFDLVRFILSEPSHDQILAADSVLLSTRAGATGSGAPYLAAQLAALQAAPAVQGYLDQDLPAPVGFELMASIGRLVRGELDPAQAMAQATEAYQ